MYKSYIKNVLDYSMSALLLFLFIPLFLLISIVLYLHFKGSSPFFVQTRPGKNQKPFQIIKFKTMADKTDENGVLLSDSKRLTPIGMAVRKSSLDELPQLINVLKGEMSLVGPRPLLYKYIPLHSQDQLKRYDIKPGITGWAQIKGRNAISWTQKFDLDIEYVENMSFLFDVKIFLMTLKKVVNRDDIYQKGNNIVPPFNGKN